MKTFQCNCGNRLFFHNTQCVQCGCEVGWCPGCREITSLKVGCDSPYQCGKPDCGISLSKCHNFAREQVCNRCVSAEFGAFAALCDCCRLNDMIPDLSVYGNRHKWRLLETAKRRMLYSLDLLRLPYGRSEDGIQPPLSFDFKSDVDQHNAPLWHFDGQRVFTGHKDGKITINIREADPVEREKARVQFGEPKRTLIGHFRHEIGHYYWLMLVQGRCENDFAQLFGDHNYPSYDVACQRYHQQGPAPDWSSRCISAYASMHPWEDFAETFATFLDVVSVLDVAHHQGFGSLGDPRQTELQILLDAYVDLGLKINEINRSMGLTDLVPEIFVPPAVEKLRFVHNLVRWTTPSE